MTNTSPLTDWQGSITIFKSFTGTRPNTELVDVSWDEVVNTIKPNSPTVLEDKTKGQCFLPCALKDAPLIGTTLALAEEEGESTVGKMCSKQHVTPANILVIDIDGISKSNLDLASEKMKHDDVTFLAYTTFSQGLKTDMRVRLALPLDRAITVEEYPTAWHGFDALYFKGEIGELDPSGAKLYQQQALWCCHPERLDQADSWEHKAGVIFADSLIKKATKQLETIKVVAKGKTDYPPADANKIADKCQQIGAFRDNRGADQSEPTWFDCLGIVGHCVDGGSLCHEWSNGHDNYNHFQTEKKLAHRLATPPTTCDQFKRSNPDGCIGCTQTCKSPIALGQQRDDEADIKALAKLSQFDYDRVRHDKAEELGVQLKTLDAKVKDARKSNVVKSEPVEIEPYHEEVNPAELFDEIKALYLMHIIMDTNQAIAATLWTVMTWVTDEVNVLPLLLINAPERACGKTQLLGMVSLFSCRSMVCSNITTAVLFRCIDTMHPTLFIDEIDTFLKKNIEIQGLINAGHTRTSAYVWRLVGDNHEPKQFSVWAPKAFAGINLPKHLSEATLSRGIVINMRRKLANESVIRIRRTDKANFEVLKSKLARFAQDYSDLIRNTQIDLPDELSDRDQDNWEPLLTIAQCAGNEWLTDANEAALNLSKSENVVSINTELLSDIREIFAAHHEGKMSSADLIKLLVSDSEAPWATWNNVKPFSARQLTKLLEPYGIKTKNLKFGPYHTLKGFELAQFEDAFDRYLEHEILPQIRNDAPQAMNYMPSSVADKTQPKSIDPQSYEDLF
jgi:Protein of unknown function (DUF3631)